MRPLHRADPSGIDGYRLLGRLGAGGMGVVYLARSAGGALAAVKLIRAEHAADPGFRERFRREARTAERITGRWVVRVLGADPEAHEPWLATEFVPGPSLAEAVELHGALPEPTVRALGARLADALHTVHEGGLVHRDVKPGNVLLALDGPRLIDFGIARSTGATALTATDAMIGTPGFLAPEQARVAGSGEVGPAADVFSLGCVLAYALTGRRPFGTGAVAAVVYRTVHQEPDLEGLPEPLLPLVTACLAKDAAARPTAAAVRAALGAYESGAGDWLPPGLPALIAERSARVLDLPVADPTMVEPEAPKGTSRRRLLALGSAGAVAGVGGVTAWLLGRGPGGSGGAGSGGTGSGGSGGGQGGARATYTVAVLTDLTGPGKVAGRAQERGVRSGARAFNARQDRPFDLAVKVVDDGGDARRAEAAARSLVRVPGLLAVLGPTNPATGAAAGNVLSLAPVPFLNVVTSVKNGVIGAQTTQRKTYFELRPSPDVMLVPFGRVLTALKVIRTAAVEDQAAGQYSWLAAKTLRTSPPSGDAGGRTTIHQVAADSEDFGPAVREALATRPGGVYYLGDSPRRAALFARALHAQGYRGPRGTVEAVMQPEFLDAAGREAAEGWYFGTSFVDADALGTAKAKAFAADYRAQWGIPAGTPVDRYAIEVYDLIGWTAEATRSALADHAQNLPAALCDYFMSHPYQGIAKRYRTDFDTSQDAALNGLFLWHVQDGAPRFLGPYDEAARKLAEQADGSS